jgi:cytochrome c oxidase subunit 1
MIIGLAMCVVPPQIGANSIIFPRAAAFGFWVWFLGSGITVFGFLADGGFGSPELDSQREAVALTLVGLLLVIAGICVSVICLLTTIISGRCMGMNLRRIPVFSWTIMVSGTLWILTLPVLAANSIIAYVDLRGRSAIYFGSEDVIWDQISWVFTHPQIYVFVLPLIGIAYDIVPVAVKVRQKLYNHDLVLIFSSLFGIIGFGAYAQPFFDTPGTPVREEALYVLTAFLAVPLALLLFGGLFETLRMGSKNLTRHPPAPLILSLLSIFLLISGAVVGALRAIEPFELLSTSSNTAQMKLTIGAGLVAIIAAMLWWGGLIVGKTAKQGFGLISGILITAGSLLSGLADSVNGFLGLDDFTTVGFLQEVSAEQIVKILIAFSFIGSVLIFGGAVVLILVELLRFKNGPVSELDPWEGHTLEWTDEIVMVESERPLLDEVGKTGT